jgi:integrase
MSVIERARGKYTIEIPVGKYSNGSQKRYTETFYCSKKSEAKAREAELKAKFKGGELTQVNKINFEKFTKMWVEQYAEKNLKAKTLYRYKELLDSRIIPALGRINLDKLMPMDILVFENKLRENGARKDGKSTGGLSERTVLHHHRLISTILGAAVRWGYITHNPAQKIDKPKNIQKDIEFLTLEQINRLIDALKDEDIKYQALMILALETGARRGEIMALNWKDIDFKNNSIRINKAVQFIPNDGLNITTVKTKSSNRTISISENIISILKSYKRIQEREKNDLSLGDDFIFTSPEGSQMHPDTVTHFMPKFIKKHNNKISKDQTLTQEEKDSLYLPKVSFHGLRHSNATLLISQNVNMKTVSSRLGHANISTTLDIYTKAISSADKEVAEKLGAILSQ